MEEQRQNFKKNVRKQQIQHIRDTNEQFLKRDLEIQRQMKEELESQIKEMSVQIGDLQDDNDVLDIKLKKLHENEQNILAQIACQKHALKQQVEAIEKIPSDIKQNLDELYSKYREQNPQQIIDQIYRLEDMLVKQTVQNQQ